VRSATLKDIRSSACRDCTVFGSVALSVVAESGGL
jgi:hypothetical protein